MSKIVKSRQVVLNEEKYKLSPLIISEMEFEASENDGDSTTNSDNLDDDSTKSDHNVIEIDIESILEDAKCQADEIIQSAKSEQEKILKDAYDDGMQIMETSKKDGYEKGYKEGYNDGKKKADVIVSEANKIKTDAVKKYKEYNLNSEEILINLVLDVCEKILNDTMEEKGQYITNLVKKSLEKITQTDVLKIRVSEQDYINLISAKNEILPLLDRVDDLQIVQDASIKKGSLLLETDNGSIDGSIWTQFEQVKIRFEELMKSE